MFPTIYDSEYDQSLQRLVLQFLSQLEQLLPIPDLQQVLRLHLTLVPVGYCKNDHCATCFQTAAWLTATPSVSEELGQHVCEPSALKTLLLHHRQMENLSSGQFSTFMCRLLALVALSHIFFPVLQLLPAAMMINWGPL